MVISSDQQWICEQIEAYRQVQPRYQRTTAVIEQILKKACEKIAPQAIIQTRPKSIPSFAEKAQRKKNKYRDPLQRMTDLSGGRVIAQSQEEVKAICEFIEQNFIIDAENSVDLGQRLKPSEFGYRSIHYIVQFKKGVFPTARVPVEITDDCYPDPLNPMKAEIQVRTVLEHAWAGFVHDRVYKGAFAVPPKWERELAVLAGMVEQIDGSFSRIQEGLRAYAANYGAYLSHEQIKGEIAILETVLNCNPQNPEMAHRIGKLYMELGQLQKAIEIFYKFIGEDYQPILRDLGVVLCKVHAADPAGNQYQLGQQYLEKACQLNKYDTDALASLAGTWKRLDVEKTRDLYRRAFEVDPTDPYAVSNYLVYEIIHQESLAPAGLMSPSIKAAIQRCNDQVEVGMNIPWAYYNLGLFNLLSANAYESLNAYMLAIQHSSTEWMIETSQRLLEKLSCVRPMLSGYDAVLKLLKLYRACKFSDPESLAQVKNWSLKDVSFTEPVIIIAGSTNSADDIDHYQDLLIDSFSSFNGTLISGGTTAGISGFVGRVQSANPDSIRTVGYIPADLPPSARIDPAYNKICRTDGQNFSALEPLQYWIDIIASGVSPNKIKLIGISGGEISTFEYRLALMLGAHVALIKNSGRAVTTLLNDPYWSKKPLLFSLAEDVRELIAFVNEPDR